MPDSNEEEKSSRLSLSIVVEDKTTYRDYFDPELTMKQIAESAVKETAANFMFKGDWRLTKGDGEELPMTKKLKDLPVRNRDTLYLTLIHEPNFRKNYPQDKITTKL